MKWVSTNFIIMDGQRTANFQLGQSFLQLLNTKKLPSRLFRMPVKKIKMVAARVVLIFCLSIYPT